MQGEEQQWQRPQPAVPRAARFTRREEGALMRHILVRLAVGCIVLSVAYLARPGTVAAQTGKITGVVRDSASNQPLEGVEVYIEGTGVAVNTASNGRYFLISVPPGVYTLVAPRPGYPSTAVRGVSVVIDVTREQNFHLTHAQSETLPAEQIHADAQPRVEPGVPSRAAVISQDVVQ